MARLEAFTLRLPPELYRRIKALAKAKAVSINQLVCDSLAEAADRDERARLRSSFRKLAHERADIEYATKAQSEIVLEED